MNGALDDYIVSFVLLMLAVVIAFGKGDFLISGYNTASKEKKAKYDVQRLRLLVSSLLVLITIALVVAALLGWGEAEREYLSSGIAVLVVIYMILTCTWAKKK